MRKMNAFVPKNKQTKTPHELEVKDQKKLSCPYEIIFLRSKIRPECWSESSEQDSLSEGLLPRGSGGSLLPMAVLY